MNKGDGGGSERVKQGHGAKRLGFRTEAGVEYETSWTLRASDSLESAYDVLRDIDGVERVWIDYVERALDTGEELPEGALR